MTLHRDRTGLGRPLRQPLDAHLRAQIVAGIRAGHGRNHLAREHHVSTGMVSKIARQEGLWFTGCETTATATLAHQIDCANARIERAIELETLLFTTPYRRDGSAPRRVERASYALYNLDRHHNGAYPL